MRAVVAEGTAIGEVNPSFPPLSIAFETGKTGTAEYCDDVAFPQGLCIPGRWPSHAWYTGYGVQGDKDILVIAFVYNAGEGSQWALPVVRQVMDFYLNGTPIQVVLPPTPASTPPETETTEGEAPPAE